eukprot:1699724-Pyramimonas_sp.AAC.1
MARASSKLECRRRSWAGRSPGRTPSPRQLPLQRRHSSASPPATQHLAETEGTTRPPESHSRD